MIVAAVFLFLLLAVMRVTRIVTKDEIAAPFRRWATRKYGDESKMAYLVHCRWCASIWLAIPFSIAWVTTTLPWIWWWLALPGVLVMSQLTGLASRLEEEE